MSAEKYDITDVAMVCESGIPPYGIYGYVVGEDGKIYTLTDRYYHGIVIAVLYPELAASKGVAAPASPRDDLDVFEYQRFELDNSRQLPILRVAVSLTTGTTMISKGSIPATEAQIDAMARIFKALGLAARDTLTGDEDDQTVSEFLEELRQERIRAQEDSASSEGGAQ